MNILRRAYLNYDPELSRPQAAERLGVARLTVQRWENFLTGDDPSSPPEHEYRVRMNQIFGVPIEAWDTPGKRSKRRRG